MPESDVHRGLVDMLAAWLRARFAGRSDVAVFSRLAWFPDAGDTRVRLDPDVMVVFGRPPGPRRSYKSWVEDGIAPQVLIEVWSEDDTEDDTEADYERRLRRARRYGVAEVVIVHPSAPGGVRVDHLVAEGAGDDRFRTIASSVDQRSGVQVDSLGIWLSGGDELRAGDEVGPWQPTAEAVRDLRAERARAERLEAQLRAAGIEPAAERSPAALDGRPQLDDLGAFRSPLTADDVPPVEESEAEATSAGT